MIRFYTNAPYLRDHPELHPRLLRPEWFDELKPLVHKENPDSKTAKTCPGFISLFRIAIVIPLWCDIRLTRGRRFVDDEGENRFQPDPDGRFCVPTYEPHVFDQGYHDVDQVGPNFPGAFGMEVLPKPISPWLLEAPPGWSVLVMPATLHNRNPLPWEPIPGTFNCDVWHQTNMPCRYTREPDLESTIFAGTPFAYMIPFKRTEDPGGIEIELIEDFDRWAALYGEPGCIDYKEHLIESHGRSTDQ